MNIKKDIKKDIKDVFGIKYLVLNSDPVFGVHVCCKVDDFELSYFTDEDEAHNIIDELKKKISEKLQ